MDWRKLVFWRKPQLDYKILGRFDPNNMLEADRLVIEQLQNNGADLSKPRDVRHYLYLPTSNAQEQMAVELRRLGFEVEAQMAANVDQNPPNPFLVLASKDAVVNAESINELRRIFETLAAEYEGEYDGWEAAAKP